jgi:hypothetical protein
MIRVSAIALVLLTMTATTSFAQVLKKEPPAGQLRSGQRVLVDDGSCPKGQIKEVTGGSNFSDSGAKKAGAPRTRRCIPK